jgi:hypothetical protein
MAMNRAPFLIKITGTGNQEYFSYNPQLCILRKLISFNRSYYTSKKNENIFAQLKSCIYIYNLKVAYLEIAQ